MRPADESAPRRPATSARELLRRLPGAVSAVHWLRKVSRRRHGHPADHGYQHVDWRIADYEPYLLPGFPLHLRGPSPQRLIPNEYIACVGAAQTFGRFCQEPFPHLLARRLGIPVINLGVAGAGPGFFLRNPQLLRCINGSRLAVVQVMSARSEDNALFESGGQEYVTIRSTGERMGAEPAYRRLLESEDIQQARSTIMETRENWIASYKELLARMKVPTILLWFSVREPDYPEDYSDVEALFGKFPQLVNRQMVEVVRAQCDAYVQCITDRGLPQKLIDRFTGRPARVPSRADLGRGTQTENRYYPSPEMHREVADLLEPVCRGFLDGGGFLSPPRSGARYA